jgi:hypothetical protein
METVRINVRRLAALVLASLVAPLAIALILDLTLGWMPMATIAAAVIFIPLSTVIVIRATLAELEIVIQAVAPLEIEQPEYHSS